ncbi:hypothetical protein TVAG_494020 [Trichomonas vaginalis G3]|uniref:Uncharacterized protein n=1 Tax=Trichomonas vaginalis (strain ATCC PRA-98 / G3) TaxID=412133 RepID=A2DQ33_TRIV3|nr:hypothetical protein TVAG_494020 [Trichomonas vaginalis G3]|eukprot:XP_001329595.1 hypothetical protein [Trichomonas vaginalis G3]
MGHIVHPKRKTKAMHNILLHERRRLSARQMLGACIMTGMPYTKGARFLSLCGTKPPVKSGVMRQQRFCDDKIRRLKSISLMLSRKSFSDYLSIDARWTHRRNSPSCTVTALDAVTKRVLACVNINHIGGNRQHAQYSGASNNMESAGTRIILKQLKKYNILKDVKEIIKDRDNKSVSVFKEFGVSHLERFDPGHVSKNISKDFTKFSASHKTVEVFNDKTQKIEKIERPFWGLNASLSMWLWSCFAEENIDKRTKMWENCVYHYVGNHSFCEPHNYKCFEWQKGVNSIQLQFMLYDWVHKWTPIVSKVSSIGSTCMNEAFNSKIACYLDKSRAWKNINIRVNVAILEWNDPEHFLGDIQKALHLPPLPEDCVKSFEENCYSKMILKQKTVTKGSKKQNKYKKSIQSVPGGD